MSTKKTEASSEANTQREADIDGDEATSDVLRGAAGLHKSPEELRLGRRGNDGDLYVLDAKGHETVHIDGARAAILLGGHGSDGDVILKDGQGNETIHLDGQSGEVRIRDWRLRVPDYVFESGYPLRSMDEVHAFIELHGHLPDVPSAYDVQREGVDVARFAMTLLQKIEELTLYALEQKQALHDQAERIAVLEGARASTGITRGHTC